MKNPSWEKDLKEILTSLYQTGVNDGKNNLSYFPTPEEFKLKQIATLLSKEIKEIIGEDKTYKPMDWTEYYEAQNRLRRDQRKLAKKRGWKV